MGRASISDLRCCICKLSTPFALIRFVIAITFAVRCFITTQYNSLGMRNYVPSYSFGTKHVGRGKACRIRGRLVCVRKSFKLLFYCGVILQWDLFSCSPRIAFRRQRGPVMGIQRYPIRKCIQEFRYFQLGIFVMPQFAPCSINLLGVRTLNLTITRQKLIPTWSACIAWVRGRWWGADGCHPGPCYMRGRKHARQPIIGGARISSGSTAEAWGLRGRHFATQARQVRNVVLTRVCGGATC